MAYFVNWSLSLLIISIPKVLAVGTSSTEALKFISERPSWGNTTYKIFVNFTASLHATDARFLSVTIDTYEVKNKWHEFNFGSEKLQNLASALSPCDIRLGGTYADFLTFDPNTTESSEDDEGKNQTVDDYGDFDRNPLISINNFTMTGGQWDTLTSFVQKVGWSLMFDFNLFKRRGEHWDPSNADLLLNYSSQRGIKIPYFQLGNEPNSYLHNFNITIPPEILEKDFEILKNLIAKYPLYKNSTLYGPDVTNLDVPHQAVQYLQKFISSGAYNVVDGVSLHHYYLSGRTAKVQDFLNISVLNTFKKEMEVALNIVRTSPRPLPILLTETSSCFGGGAPHLSDAYLSGFMWLDKLGLAAQNGLRRVFRQAFLGAPTGLLTDKSTPNAGYYISLLYKRLIEGPVFNVSLDPPNDHIRVYAHCARNGTYHAGALVIYYMNLQDKLAVLSLSQFQRGNHSLYLLTPGDDLGLLSRYVKLNGIVLQMSHSRLPLLQPKSQEGNIVVDAWSLGFIVVPHSNIPLCLKYFANSARQ